jgi:hypothetical protein
MVSEAGVLLIIVRDNRWVEVDWLLVVLVAMVAPLRPRTMDRWSSVSGLRLRSSNHRSP